jgi:hypothetical protein
VYQQSDVCGTAEFGSLVESVSTSKTLDARRAKHASPASGEGGNVAALARATAQDRSADRDRGTDVYGGWYLSGFAWPELSASSTAGIPRLEDWQARAAGSVAV